MSEPSRKSALVSRHTAPGSGPEDRNDMGTAWSCDSDPSDEHDATAPGTRLQVKGEDYCGNAVVEWIPFFDPGKSCIHA